ncbi:ABC transporter permease subunit [Streptomyces sp. L7]
MNDWFRIPSDLQNSYFGLIGLHLREAVYPGPRRPGGRAAHRPTLRSGCWLYLPVLWVTTVLYAIPSLAFFVVLIDYTGQTETTVMIPLGVYSLVVFVPAIVDGVRSVPQETLDAATAMGLGPVRRYLQASSCRSPCPRSSPACGSRPSPASPSSASAC